MKIAQFYRYASQAESAGKSYDTNEESKTPAGDHSTNGSSVNAYTDKNSIDYFKSSKFICMKSAFIYVI